MAAKKDPKTTPKKRKTPRKTAVKKPKPINPEPIEADNTKAEKGFDRVIRSGKSGKNAACPKCGAFPTIAKIRRPGYELRRCRVCDHRFEIKTDGD